MFYYQLKLKKNRSLNLLSPDDECYLLKEEADFDYYNAKCSMKTIFTIAEDCKTITEEEYNNNNTHQSKYYQWHKEMIENMHKKVDKNQ